MTFETDRVDWWRVIEALRKAGLPPNRQAQLIGVGRVTLLGWRNHDAEPRHLHGDRLLRLFSQRCPGQEVPRQESRVVYRVYVK
jgi:hypothetical protein